MRRCADAPMRRCADAPNDGGQQRPRDPIRLQVFAEREHLEPAARGR
jgi:hypothetical protein